MLEITTEVPTIVDKLTNTCDIQPINSDDKTNTNKMTPETLSTQFFNLVLINRKWFGYISDVTNFAKIRKMFKTKCKSQVRLWQCGLEFPLSNGINVLNGLGPYELGKMRGFTSKSYLQLIHAQLNRGFL